LQSIFSNDILKMKLENILNLTNSEKMINRDQIVLPESKLTAYYRVVEQLEFKIIFGIIMGTLCLITTIGNIFVIYRYRKASMVNFLTT
jgi:hypothetical protein